MVADNECYELNKNRADSIINGSAAIVDTVYVSTGSKCM